LASIGGRRLDCGNSREATPAVTGQEARRAVAMAVAGEASLRSGDVVQVDSEPVSADVATLSEPQRSGNVVA